MEKPYQDIKNDDQSSKNLTTKRPSVRKTIERKKSKVISMRDFLMNGM